MKEYTDKILDSVFADIDNIADFIVEVSTVEHAVKYVRELQAEIMTLRYLAGIILQAPKGRQKPAAESVAPSGLKYMGGTHSGGSAMLHPRLTTSALTGLRWH